MLITYLDNLLYEMSVFWHQWPQTNCMHHFKHLKTKELFTKQNHSYLYTRSQHLQGQWSPVFGSVSRIQHLKELLFLSWFSNEQMHEKKTLAMTLKMSYLRWNCVHLAAQSSGICKEHATWKVKDVIKKNLLAMAFSFHFSTLFLILSKIPLLKNHC